MSLKAGLPAGTDALVEAVCGPDVPAALELAAQLTQLVPAPGTGSTLERWNLLAALASADLTVARVVEAHLDAVAILQEADSPLPLQGTTWGVFAAEGPGARLEAQPAGDGWVLDGVKPWCSLAGALSHALVTAHVGGDRQLFAVSLRQPGVTVQEGAWHARGLTDVPSGPVTFAAVQASPVGEPGWYLRRAGFAHGGIGVAACWYGGAVGVARALARAAARRDPDQIGWWHVGATDADLHGAAVVLTDSAACIDAGLANDEAGALLALRVRAVVAGAAERVIGRLGHALGPAPLALDAEHARRVADLTLYLRQHHAERDLAALGQAVLAADPMPW